MDIINRTGRDEGMVRTVAQHSSVAGEIFVVFLDDASAGTGHIMLSRYRAAQMRIAENRPNPAIFWPGFLWIRGLS